MDLNVASPGVYTAMYLLNFGDFMMQATANFRQERHELDTILASGIFNLSLIHI